MGESERQEERSALIADLESSLRRRSGVRPWLALTCIGCVLALAWILRADVLYFFSPQSPITLGQEDAYRLDAVIPNRYVQLHGSPISRAAFGFDRSGTFVVVGFNRTPFLIRRKPLAAEQWQPGQKPPLPNRTPFGVRGRLMTRQQARTYDEAFALLEKSPELRPQNGQLFLIVEGEKPGGDWGVPLGLALGSAFVALNVWMLVRSRRQSGLE